MDNLIKKSRAPAMALLMLLVLVSTARSSVNTITLGTAQSFAVLAATTVTSTGPTILIGDLGLHPGSSVTGFPPGTVIGAQHVTDAVALQAKNDATTAYNAIAALPCGVDLTGTDLGGLTLTPNTYCFSSSAFLTGVLTLDAEGDPGAEWYFQIGSTLITATNSSVSIINGADPCRVYWQVGSSATLEVDTNFVGNILALTSITAKTRATNRGSLIALNAAVTLDSNIITTGCITTPTPTPTNTPTDTPTNTPTDTASATPVNTATSTSTLVSTSTATLTPILTSTSTRTRAATRTPTFTKTVTATRTSTTVFTATRTATRTATKTRTPTRTATRTATPYACNCVQDVVIVEYLHRVDNKIKVKFRNNSATCAHQVGVATYKRYGGNIEDQVLYDWEEYTLAPGESKRLSARLPDCAYQADAFCGPHIVSFRGGIRYGPRLLDDKLTSSPQCD